MAVRLEHANLIVRDINGMIRFLQTAFPEFRCAAKAKVATEAAGCMSARMKPTLL
jgi:hypothetical protein